MLDISLHEVIHLLEHQPHLRVYRFDLRAQLRFELDQLPV